jgi:hypothetical protein
MSATCIDPPRPGAAHDLGEEAFDPDPLGERMAVAAVRRSDTVGVLQHRAHAGRNRLLTETQVHESRDLPPREQARQTLLGTPDQHHAFVQAQ